MREDPLPREGTADDVEGRSAKSPGDAADQARVERASSATRPVGAAIVVMIAIALVLAVGGLIVYLLR